MLEHLRQYRRSNATRIGALFACAWLALAAVPCSAMPQAAAAHGHALAGHAMPTPADDPACPHCPPAVAQAANAGDCSGVDDALPGKAFALEHAFVAPAAPPTLAPIVAARAQALDPDHAAVRPPAVPLNLRYCSFLE